MKIVVAGRDLVALAKKTVSEIVDDNVLGLSAATAYSFFFGLFPTLLFAAPLLSLLGNKQQILDEIFARIAPSLPPDAFKLVYGVLHDVVYIKNAPGLMSVGALLALLGGAGMFSALMSALNTAYDVVDTRAWWHQKLIAIGVTIGAVITIGSAMILLLGGEQLLAAVARSVNLGLFGAVLTGLVQYVLVLGLLVGSMWGIYIVLPDVKAQDKVQVLIGSVFAGLLWIVLTVLLRLYVANFGSYNKTYGTIGAVIVLLTLMYWSMFAVIAGGELNSELRAGTGTAAIKAQGLSANSRVASRIASRVATRDGLPQPSSEVN